MYAYAENIAPLPQSLASRPFQVPGRRRQVGPFRLGTLELERFNRLLSQLGREQPLEPDQIATAARDLAPAGQAVPDCIAQRLQQAASLEQMLADAAWDPANEALQPARSVLDYLHRDDGLIPGWIPGVGHLDDAIVVEAAWPRLSAEVTCYLDFRRLRGIEAQLRGVEPGAFRFGRVEWLQSRETEARLREQRRRIFRSSYVPAEPPMVRVH